MTWRCQRQTGPLRALRLPGWDDASPGDPERLAVRRDERELVREALAAPDARRTRASLAAATPGAPVTPSAQVTRLARLPLDGTHGGGRDEPA
ncbi:hypothetical protein LV28_02975 [Pandoraea pnomenusa]|nr:hypothetical protein X636_23755 [Pandoraea pnomenusa]AIU25640.2 hypothetical protein LV28_02975 [Pandoraea pnomenusa]ANC46771.1 hypothetical protein A6P55_23995 [Pandoraea pnomenusa]